MFELRRKKYDGWLAVSLAARRFDVAHLVTAAGRKPELRLLESYARAGDDATTLATLRRRAGLQRYRCTTLLGAGDYQMIQIEAPAEAAAAMKEAVRWQLKDILDYPVETATVDALEIPLDRVAPGRARSLFAVAAPNAVIAPKMHLFHAAGFSLEAIDIPELAQRNVAALLEDEKRGLALLNIDDNGSLLTFSYQGELYAARRSEIGATQFGTASTEQRAALFDRLGLELQRSLDNFDRMFGFIPLSRVIVGLCPGTDGLIDHLRDYVSLPIEPLDLARAIDFPSIPELRDTLLQSQRLAVIGAALRGEGAAGEAE